MKRALFASVVALLCACGSSGTNGNNNGTGGNGGGGGGTSGGGMDMSASAGMDMSASAGMDGAMSLPPDMLPAYGCNALLQCLDSCTDQTSCQLCVASSTTQANTYYQQLASCVRKVCYRHPDGPPAPCTQGGGNPSPQCTQCLDDVIKMSGTCQGDPMYCGQCYMQYAACTNDKP